MVEFNGGFAYAHRESVTRVIGTESGTILAAAPPQMSYELTEVVVTGYGGGTASGRLMQFATLQGYSQYGTTQGTVVEPFQLNGEAFVDGNGDAPVAYVDPGNLLYGQADYGSVLVKVVYRPISKRGW